MPNPTLRAAAEFERRADAEIGPATPVHEVVHDVGRAFTRLRASLLWCDHLEMTMVGWLARGILIRGYRNE